MNGLIPWVRYVGSHTGVATSESTSNVEFSLDLRNFHQGGELGREKINKNYGRVF